MASPRAYVIEWLDHMDVGGDYAWYNIAEIEAVAPRLRSVGFVVKETDEALYLAHTADEEQSSCPFLILKSAIVERREIRVNSPRRKPKG